MPIHFRENQYNGINAHLQSLLQQDGWESFHSAHITHLTEAIDQLLPYGYYVVNEKSLQISAIDPRTGDLSRTAHDRIFRFTNHPPKKQVELQ